MNAQNEYSELLTVRLSIDPASGQVQAGAESIRLERHAEHPLVVENVREGRVHSSAARSTMRLRTRVLQLISNNRLKDA